MLIGWESGKCVEVEKNDYQRIVVSVKSSMKIQLWVLI